MTPEIRKKRAEDLADMLAEKLREDLKRKNPRTPPSDNRGWFSDGNTITVYFPEQGGKVAFTIHYLDSLVHNNCINGINIELRDNEPVKMLFERILKTFK